MGISAPAAKAEDSIFNGIPSSDRGEPLPRPESGTEACAPAPYAVLPPLPMRASGANHGPRRRLRLEWQRLSQPFAGRQGDHRHELERTPLLRAEGGQERRFQYEEQRHAKTELIARYWHVANPRRFRARNARSF